MSVYIGSQESEYNSNDKTQRDTKRRERSRNDSKRKSLNTYDNKSKITKREKKPSRIRITESLEETGESLNEFTRLSNEDTQILNTKNKNFPFKTELSTNEDYQTLVRIACNFGRAADLICLSSASNSEEAVKELIELKVSLDSDKRLILDNKIGHSINSDLKGKIVRSIETSLLFSKLSISSPSIEEVYTQMDKQVKELYERVSATIEGRSPELLEKESRLLHELNLVRALSTNLLQEEYNCKMYEDKMAVLEYIKSEIEQKQDEIIKEGHVG